jgi:hypothetical protein
MLYRPFQYTGKQAIRQLKARYNRFIKSRSTFRAYVAWLVRDQQYSLREVADLLGFSNPSSVQNILQAFDKDQSEVSNLPNKA